MATALRDYLAGETPDERAVNFLSAFREVKLLAIAVTIMNMGGVAYGIYYYWDQLFNTPAYLLPFVPDSPTGPFLMIVAYCLWWFRGHKRVPTLELLAFVYLLKFGIWTQMAFVFYQDYFFSEPRALLTWTLAILHGGEALQAGVLLKGMRLPTWPWTAFAFAWLALSDVSDYVLGTHPILPAGQPAEPFVPVITVALTFICFGLAVGWCLHLARLRPDGARRELAETESTPDGRL